MTLAVNITDGHGLSDKARCELLPKKSKVCICCLLHGKRCLSSCTLLTRCQAERFSFKSECAVLVAKLMKEDWLIVLQ